MVKRSYEKEPSRTIYTRIGGPSRKKKVLTGLVVFLLVESSLHLVESSVGTLYLASQMSWDWDTALRTEAISHVFGGPFVGMLQLLNAQSAYNDDSTAYKMLLDRFSSASNWISGKLDQMLKLYSILEPVISDHETLLLILGGKDSLGYVWKGLADFNDGVISQAEETELAKLMSNYLNNQSVTKRFIFAASDLNLDSSWPNWGINLRARYLTVYAADPNYTTLTQIVQYSPTINNELLLGYASSSTQSSPSSATRKAYCEANPDVAFATVAVNAPAFGVQKTKIEDQVNGQIVDLPEVRAEIVKLGAGNLKSTVRPDYTQTKKEFFNDALDFVHIYIIDGLKGRGDEILHIVDFSGGAENASPPQVDPITGIDTGGPNRFVGTVFGNAPSYVSFKGSDKEGYGPYLLGAIRMYEFRKSLIDPSKIKFSDGQHVNDFDDAIVSYFGESYRSGGGEPRTMQWKKFTLVGCIPEDIVRILSFGRFESGFYAQDYIPRSDLVSNPFPTYEKQIKQTYTPWNWHKEGKLFENYEG
jgi:hypothetical protein